MGDEVTVLNRVKADVDSGVVLIIDDEEDWVAECQFMLDSFGFPSIGVTSGDEALNCIADPAISTIIIDYSMPGYDGISLIQELAARAESGGRELSFIMATGHATLEVAVGAMRASAVDFLQKPITRDDLRNALLRVRGVKTESPARKALAAQLSGLSAEMQRLSGLIGGRTPLLSAERAANAASPDQITSDFIRSLLKKENKRRSLANGMLFGDPAWDMLLDLLVAKFENRRVSVSSACIASGAPTTTALRLVNRLVNEDILFRAPDERDGRRDFLTLNPAIEEPLLAYLSELANS